MPYEFGSLSKPVHTSAYGKLMLGHIQTFKFSANDKSAEYLKNLTDELPAFA